MGISKTVVTKAVSDAAFRDRLVKDPKTTITKELGIEVPQNVSIQLHQNSDTVIHIVLPHTDKALSEKELAQVAGGGGFAIAGPLPGTLLPQPGTPLVGAISPLPWMPIRFSF
jgi:hypothetical protein